MTKVDKLKKIKNLAKHCEVELKKNGVLHLSIKENSPVLGEILSFETKDQKVNFKVKLLDLGDLITAKTSSKKDDVIWDKLKGGIQLLTALLRK